MLPYTQNYPNVVIMNYYTNLVVAVETLLFLSSEATPVADVYVARCCDNAMVVAN